MKPLASHSSCEWREFWSWWSSFCNYEITGSSSARESIFLHEIWLAGDQKPPWSFSTGLLFLRLINCVWLRQLTCDIIVFTQLNEVQCLSRRYFWCMVVWWSKIIGKLQCMPYHLITYKILISDLYCMEWNWQSYWILISDLCCMEWNWKLSNPADSTCDRRS